ncbi:MbcA/ParS/Xre antitoxin family protein [Oceanithermus sp.]|uniref:MbcA/ParS/Xre antitoxin family protein n=1 Tax=Oceanithermus sp. TaxID=2268145 RepID=UPI002579E6C0|nr:MbcA/ParS/Xre antitoxin family protein [Oceanithermus sp.]
MLAPVEKLRSKRGHYDTRRIADYLGVPLKQVAEATGVSRQLLYQHPDAPKAQPRAAAIERIIAGLQALYGTPEAVRAWMKTPALVFGGRTAWEVIRTEPQGLEAVEAYVENLKEGNP